MGDVATRWHRGAAWGAITIALLAAVALAATVVVASHGVDAAAGTLTRGEAEVLLAASRSELMLLGGPPSPAELARVVAHHEAEGLRYLAVVHAPRGVEVEAGVPSLGDPAAARPDALVTRG
ncbi:MAG TPA: hypothetical protein VGI39_28075, partial [Polyangiaceae bacterium]